MVIHLVYVFLIIAAYIIGFMVGVSKSNEHDNIAKRVEQEDNGEPNVENGRHIIEQARNRKDAYLKHINKN
jgi:hypothetical protein